jgi:hypothetical protein
MAITSGEPGFRESNALKLALELTKPAQNASEPRHRLQHLIHLDERVLIDLEVKHEFGLLFSK